MGPLTTSARHVFHNICKTAAKAMSTNVMLNPKDEPKEIILKYLDGKDNGIAVLGLNRPNVCNALGKTLVNQLTDAISSMKEDTKLQVLIIRSMVPKIFCAGADLRERTIMDTTGTAQFVSCLRNMMNNIESLPTPVISAIDGAALGGGLELALATDIRVAASEATMGLVETKWAIIPGAGGTQRLPRIIGPAKAKELIYTARLIDGQEAMKIGLINQVVPQNKEGDAAYQSALSIAREILPNGPLGVRVAKTAISKGLQGSITDGLEIEEQCYNEIVHSKDRLEGLAAFAAKRMPVYQGM
ncbi:methylglutaconyl-CoA hydratase, mitochondrial [Osmia bicornis bicornis]|uniref:methylglutaconyl-CoA hydratase, mitochondrial n=1 Tax=Osmia bicornis bicornis TaxID=1437191 RepID=UPI0010F5DAE1|nr:methylglutaconyl-CoA hydratase, mitochondrial [Osmia bicornis bicornis]XP_029041148.1 methylglutaconyl-CoA hydratase, mitochondrial [Osmia bicornis bicornis]